MALKEEDAAKEGDFAEAEKVYRDHLKVAPDDVALQIKYADALWKVAPTPKRQLEALERYKEILTRYSGHDDVRRKQMELKVAMGLLYDLRGGAADGGLGDPPE